MPLNEIERHPYLHYFMDTEGFKSNGFAKYTKLIIGSFPIYEITETILPADRIEQRFKNGSIELPFFYGSKSNLFWEFLAKTLKTDNPKLKHNQSSRVDSAIRLLDQNCILLTDVVRQTNRYAVEKGKPNSYSPADIALFNNEAEQYIIDEFETNNEIIDWIQLGKNIKSIYFTAKYISNYSNPGKWFFDIVNAELISYRINWITDYAATMELQYPTSELRLINLFFFAVTFKL